MEMEDESVIILREMKNHEITLLTLACAAKKQLLCITVH